MIVVCADDDRLLRAGWLAARKDADHVPHRAPILRQELDVIDLRVREIARTRLEITVDLARDGIELPRLDDRLRLGPPDPQHWNRMLFRVRILSKQCIGRIIGLVSRIADDEQNLRAVAACERRLGRERRLRHRSSAVQATGAVALLRLVTEDENRLVGDVDAGIVVVAHVWYGEAVTRKDE